MCPDDAKQDSLVYCAEFGIAFLAKGPRTASIQESLDCLSLYLSGLEGERHVWLTQVPPDDAHPASVDSPGDFSGGALDFGDGTPPVVEGLHLLVDLPGFFYSHHCPRCTRWKHVHRYR